jgi:hypothetical protein
MPFWTLGGPEAVLWLGLYAGYADEKSMGKIYDKFAIDERSKEVSQGKNPAQVALDHAAYLLNSIVASGESTVLDADVNENLADFYVAGGLDGVATVVRY